MSTQQNYSEKFPEEFDLGKTTVKWRGKTYESVIVHFTRGIVTARDLQETGAPKSTHESSGTIVVSLLKDTPATSFEQPFEAGVTDQQFGWALDSEGNVHQAVTGSIKGNFTAGHNGIKATIEMTFANKEQAFITFEAQKRG